MYSPSLTSCATCNTLYYPVLNNTVCGYLGYYCAALNNNSSCIACNPGLTLLNQNGTNICIRPIYACVFYDSQINCISCTLNFVLQYNKCKSIHCASFNFTSGICLACVAGYNYINSTGACIDQNCISYVAP